MSTSGSGHGQPVSEQQNRRRSETRSKTCQQEQQEGGGLRLLTFHSDQLGRVTIPED
jgi:hypothetical protein